MRYHKEHFSHYHISFLQIFLESAMLLPAFGLAFQNLSPGIGDDADKLREVPGGNMQGLHRIPTQENCVSSFHQGLYLFTKNFIVGNTNPSREDIGDDDNLPLALVYQRFY
jgi:hypothetical protein